ncbi:MAG: hypothetical protein BGO98_34780 [Myxococcales bacterium 68-20]|nr:MAG: hypothetical protein BGO98_34780 [Myxococcales bacterium 68-20]
MTARVLSAGWTGSIQTPRASLRAPSATRPAATSGVNDSTQASAMRISHSAKPTSRSAPRGRRAVSSSR